jgi:hypothetical protein
MGSSQGVLKWATTCASKSWGKQAPRCEERKKSPEAEAGFPMREVWSPDEIWSAFIQRVLLEHTSSPQSHGPEDSACEGR